MIVDVYISAIDNNEPIGKIENEARRQEIEKISNERVKREKYCAWKLLCHALKNSFGLEAEKLDFGKLECGAWTVEGAEISISHSDDAVAVAVSSNPVGIDIERVHKPRSDRMAEFIMNERELKIFNLLPDEEKEERLIEIWTKKEAIFKTKKANQFIPKEIDTNSYPTKTITTTLNSEKYVCTVATKNPQNVKFVL